MIEGRLCRVCDGVCCRPTMQTKSTTTITEETTTPDTTTPETTTKTLTPVFNKPLGSGECSSFYNK